MPMYDDISGQKFNMLTAIKYVGVISGGAALYKCKCDCGTVKNVRAKDLKGGHAISCGCYRKARMTVHGNRHLPEYSVWKGMRARCNNKGHLAYKNYGARGISVCERWNVFANFLADMGLRPTPHHTIERKNNHGNYEPGNCKWDTQQNQCRNFRRNRLVTWNGETKCVAEWAELTSLRPGLIISRLNKNLSLNEVFKGAVHAS